MIVCPYNPSHLVPETRFQVHLVRCRRSHQDTDMVVCSWNSTHVLPKGELKEHERNCPDSLKFLRSSVGSSVTTSSSFGGSNANSARWEIENQTDGHDEGRALQEEEEDWEKEAVVKESYNPIMATEKKLVVRKFEGATPAQRKEFRKRERERIQKLEKDQEMMKLFKQPEKKGKSGILLKKVSEEKYRYEFPSENDEAMKVENQEMTKEDKKGNYDEASKVAGVREGLEKMNIKGRGRGKGRGRISWSVNH